MLEEAVEQRIIASSQHGDVQAFNVLVDHYETQVYNLALRMLGDGAAAADVAQETLLAAFQNIRSFRGGSFRSWLLRITTNRCYDQMRVRKRRPAESLDALLVESDDNLPIIPTQHIETPEEYAERRELARTIQRGLLTLPEDQRLVLVLADVQGLDYQEVADVTASSLGTVKSRLSRARARMRDFLTQSGELSRPTGRHEDGGAFDSRMRTAPE